MAYYLPFNFVYDKNKLEKNIKAQEERAELIKLLDSEEDKVKDNYQKEVRKPSE